MGFENIIFAQANANEEVERQLLGALCNNPDLIDEIGDILSAEYFYSPLNRSIFGRIYTAAQTGEPIDLFILGQSLSPEDRHVLTDISRRNSNGAAAAVHIATLRELWQRRQIQALCEEGSTLVSSALKPEQIITSFQDSLDKIASPLESDIISSEEADRITFDDIDALFQEANSVVPRTPVLPGIRTGFTGLDDIIGGLQKGHMVLVGGRPSMGKSSLLTNIATNIANSGTYCGFISYEMTVKQMYMRSIASMTKFPTERMSRGDMTPEEYEDIVRNTRGLSQLPIGYIYNPGNIDRLILTMRKLVRTKKAKVIIIDYINLITGGVGSNATEKLGDISAKLKGAAAALDVPIVIACQLNRQNEGRDDLRPQLTDLKTTGNLEQDADVVFFVHREEYYLSRRAVRMGAPGYNEWVRDMDEWANRAELLVRKNRHGRIGESIVSFNSQTTHFDNLAA